MIQILKQRPFVDKSGTIKKPISFLSPKMEVESVQDLFFHLETHLETIPEEDKWNLHYSICECEDAKRPRSFSKQYIIPFDIDGIDIDRIDSYVDHVLAAIGTINGSDAALVYSGRGIHILIGTVEPITDPNHFKKTKKFYKLICDRIDRRLEKAGLPGNADPGLWSAGHTLRLPGTMNIKNEKLGYPGVDFKGPCELIQRVINPIDTNIMKLAGVDVLPTEVVQVRSKYLGGTFNPDSEGILDECEFIKWCRDNQSEIKEPQWYAMLSIVGHLEDGKNLAHEFSNKHPRYDYDETQSKLDQAITCSGPRTCESIDNIWSGCKECKHYGKCTSPITLKSKNYIKTKDTGFREIIAKQIGVDVMGNPLYKDIPGKVAIDDLRKFFEQKCQYISTDAKMVYIYNGKHWEYYPDNRLDGFCQDHVSPTPRNNDCAEFRSMIHRTCIVANDFFENTTSKKINLDNGILDISGDSPVLKKHSPKYGFLNVLSYGYDSDATCLSFDNFMDQVTMKREELKKVLLEFAGYAFSNDKCVHAKALILLGYGSNGKSTFLNTLTRIAGEGAYSSLTAKDLENEQQRAQLQGKLFNLAEETPNKAFVDSSTFKNIVSGGSLTIKVIYKPPYIIRPRTKLMMATNELPRSLDTTKGFMRRLIIVPFDAEFSHERNNIDIHIEDRIEAESPGILNRILEGYKRLTEQGGFTKSQVIEEITEGYREENDYIQTFVNDCVIAKEVGTNRGTFYADIYKSFKYYCDEQGIKHFPPSNKFSAKLKHYISDFKERKTRKGTMNKVFLRGVYLADPFEKEPF